MIPSCVRTVVFFDSRGARIFLSIVLAQTFAPQIGSRMTARAQESSKQKSSVTSKSQKVANPLNDLLDEARRDIDKGEFEAAIPPLQKVIADQPDFAYAHFQLAYVYTALKKTEEARSEYERTIALDPKMTEAYLDLGILLLDKDPAAAVAPLTKAAALLPAQSRPHFLLGVALERSGDLTAAASAFENAVVLDPLDLDTLVHLGDAYLALNRPVNAETKFRNVIERQPQEPRALLGLARSLDTQKKAEAMEAYQKLLAVQPSNSAARSRLVHLLLEQKQYDAAYAEMSRTDSGKPSLELLKLRADIQIGQKKWDDAVETLRQALALAPGDAEIHGGLGRVYMQKKDYPSAEKELRTALQLDGKNLAYWKDLSSTFYLGGNCSATLGTLDEIAKVEQPVAGTWFIRALCYDKLKQLKPALEAYQKFLDLDQEKNPDQVWQARERSKVLRRMLEQKR
jgi:tetratricopeptide (TPR) repeat protein